MGRREFFEEQKLKRLVYVFSITLVVSIAIFLTIFVMYNKKLKEESSQSLMSLEKMNDIVDNSELEEASYSSDSTVKNSNNTSNTVSSNNTNKETSDKTKNNISKTPIGSTVQNTTKENTSLLCIPIPAEIALMVQSLFKMIAPVYLVEEVVGVEPSVV